MATAPRSYSSVSAHSRPSSGRRRLLVGVRQSSSAFAVPPSLAVRFRRSDQRRSARSGSCLRAEAQAAVHSVARLRTCATVRPLHVDRTCGVRVVACRRASDTAVGGVVTLPMPGRTRDRRHAADDTHCLQPHASVGIGQRPYAERSQSSPRRPTMAQTARSRPRARQFACLTTPCERRRRLACPSRCQRPLRPQPFRIRRMVQRLDQVLDGVRILAARRRLHVVLDVSDLVDAAQPSCSAASR